MAEGSSFSPRSDLIFSSIFPLCEILLNFKQNSIAFSLMRFFPQFGNLFRYLALCESDGRMFFLFTSYRPHFLQYFPHCVLLFPFCFLFLVCLFVCLLVFLLVCLLVCLVVCLLVCVFVCLLVCLFVCLFVCVLACSPLIVAAPVCSCCHRCLLLLRSLLLLLLLLLPPACQRSTFSRF